MQVESKLSIGKEGSGQESYEVSCQYTDDGQVVVDSIKTVPPAKEVRVVQNIVVAGWKDAGVNVNLTPDSATFYVDPNYDFTVWSKGEGCRRATSRLNANGINIEVSLDVDI